MFGFFSGVARTAAMDTVRTLAATTVGMATYKLSSCVHRVMASDEGIQEMSESEALNPKTDSFKFYSGPSKMKDAGKEETIPAITRSFDL